MKFLAAFFVASIILTGCGISRRGNLGDNFEEKPYNVNFQAQDAAAYKLCREDCMTKFSKPVKNQEEGTVLIDTLETDSCFAKCQKVDTGS